MIDVFGEAKARVPVPEAAMLYGYRPNRAGFICCPLHGEKTPSLKLYRDHWHCYGCGEGGDVIRFVSQILGLDQISAVRRLNEDFRLGLPLDRPPTTVESAEIQRRKHTQGVYRDFMEWREKMLHTLCYAYREGHLALLMKPPDSWTDGEALAVKWMPALLDWQEALDCSSMAAQMQIFRDRREVTALCNRILSNSPGKSSAV